MSQVPDDRGGLDGSAVSVDTTSTIESRPPRTAARLGVAAQMAIAALKAHAARTDDELPDDPAQHISDARRSGLSWELIGWSLGMDGEAARNRWGSDQASR